MMHKENGNSENPSKFWKKNPIIIEKDLKRRVNGKLDMTDEDSN